MNAFELPHRPRLRSGKVREVFDLGREHLLFVATDRISAFDCILPDPIPHKGAVLTQLSAFWFHRFDFVKNHLVTTDFDAFPEDLRPYREALEGRSMVVRKSEPLPIECVARGYLAGSGWAEYRERGTVGGHPLPPGLRQADPLPGPLFTPATKAESGHDINITWDECRALVGDAVARSVREMTLRLYEAGSAYARERGIIVADTKFEFGLCEGEVILIDECLTPDSSRFWPADAWAPGGSPPSFDKQYVRDYLETLAWDKTPPAPALPETVIARTSEKYREAYERLTGHPFPLRRRQPDATR